MAEVYPNGLPLRPTVEQLLGRTYATFTENGIKVDVMAYLRSPAGRAALTRLGANKHKLTKS